MRNKLFPCYNYSIAHFITRWVKILSPKKEFFVNRPAFPRAKKDTVWGNGIQKREGVMYLHL